MIHKAKEYRKTISQSPNPVIANIMYLGGLIEHRGRGLSMMARECERVGLPTPTFYQNGTIVKIIFARPKDIDKDTVEVIDSTSKRTVELQQEHSGSTVEVQLNKIIRLVNTIGEDWLASYELREIMSFKSKTTFRQNYLNPAVKLGYVRLKYPESPNVPNQRYGLTLKGKALYYEHRNNENDPQNDPQIVQADPQNDPQKDIIIRAIRENDSISRSELASIAGCSESTIKRRLKEWNIAWLGHPKTGHWVFVKDIQ